MGLPVVSLCYICAYKTYVLFTRPLVGTKGNMVCKIKMEGEGP